MAEKFDLIIVGGGMVGLCLATLLKEQFKIAVVDPQPLVVEPTKDWSSRVSAISRATEIIFTHCGVWKELSADRISAYQSMRVWDANGSEELTFSAQQIAQPNLGYIIENQWLRHGLAKVVLKYDSCIGYFNDTVTDVEHSESRVRCILGNGVKIEAPLMVGADGAHSWVRKTFNFSTKEYHYHQQALVANVSVEHSHQQTAWQRFLATGPIAFLPMPDQHTCSIVWSADNGLAKRVLSLSPPEQSKRIAAAFDYRLGNVELVTKLNSFSLVARHAENYLQDRIVLIGDAAHTIHPLAGQGVNLGFLDAAQLAEVLVTQRVAGKDWGLKASLRAFERKRKGENHLVQKTMTLLNSVYGSENPAVVVARNLGVQLINRPTILKRELIERALGINHDLLSQLSIMAKRS